MRCPGGVAVIALVLVAAACSGDDASDAATTGVPTTTSAAPSTTAAPETTTATSTTESRVPTTSSTAAPETTAATVNNSAPDDEFTREATAVIEQTEASWQVVLLAFGDPFNEQRVGALADYFTGNQLKGFNNLIRDFRQQNLRTVARPEFSDTYDAEPRSLALSLDAGVATVQVCHIETSLIVETGGNADGTDRVVKDEIEKQVVELDLERVDGRWKVASARTPEVEIAACP